MDVNNLSEIKDGDPSRPVGGATSVIETQKPRLLEATAKKKRRRGKTKRKIMKPFLKVPWQERRKYDKTKRNNRFRKIVLAKTRAPFNNNQFLMEIHKPEPENNFHIMQTPSARTRDSSFSIDSEDNYFFSLPEDEEEYLTKEFSSVYEDAQSERLSNMSKDELIQEYLLLEAKYDNLVKRTERRPKYSEDKDCTETGKDTSMTDKDSMLTDRDTSGNSIESNTIYEPSISEIMQRLKEQEDQIRDLKLANEKLQHENDHLRQTSQGSTSEDSESDSSSSSGSCSSSSRSVSPVNNLEFADNHNNTHENGIETNVQNEEVEEEPVYPLVNGFHSPKE